MLTLLAVGTLRAREGPPMLVLETWMEQRGPVVAAALDSQAEMICGQVSARLASEFPTLCYFPSRIDAVAFQQHTFREVPLRFHRTVQALLFSSSLAIIEREYRWGWAILTRYGVTQEHLLAQIRWYFEAAQAFTQLDADDRAQLSALAAATLAAVERVTTDVPPPA
jgi:hypothetical protein